MIRRYDVRSTPFRRNDRHKPVVVLSSPHLSDSETVVVAPVYPQLLVPPNRTFYVPVVIDDEPSTIAVPLLSGVSLRRLRTVRVNLLAWADDIDRAIHRLFTGF